MAKRVYDEEFKKQAVGAAKCLGAKRAAEDIGISLSTLNRWIKSHNYDTENTAGNAEAFDEPMKTDDFLDDDDSDYDCDDLFCDYLVPKEPDENSSIYADDIFGEEIDTDDFPDYCFTSRYPAESVFNINSCMLPGSDCDDLYDQMCLDGSIRNYYFVDYENVNHTGLAGLERLSENDCIRIYYGGTAHTIPFTYIRKLDNLPARVEYTKVLLPITNGADCQILFEILQAYKSCPYTHYYIISGDSDFDVPIEEFRRIFGLNVIKIRRIADAFSESVQMQAAYADVAFSEQLAIPPVSSKQLSKAEEIDFIFNSQLDMPPYIEHRSEILNLLKTAPDKLTLNSQLIKLIPGNCVSHIFKIYKNILQNIPQSAYPKGNAEKHSKTREEWISEVSDTYDTYFKNGIYSEKRELILTVITAADSKLQINSNLCKIIPGSYVSEIFRIMKDLLNNIPKK